jgi:superfamily II DNA helicase RecQ
MFSQYCIIIVTSALELGINLTDVQAVIHIKTPYNLLDYAQESRRARQDSKISKAVIL